MTIGYVYLTLRIAYMSMCLGLVTWSSGSLSEVLSMEENQILPRGATLDSLSLLS